MKPDNPPKASPEVVSRWWKLFVAAGKKNDHLRNMLLENYLPLVKATAEKLHHNLPEEVDVQDLISAGVLGLIDAIKGFDPNRGFKFETYCTPRIRGSMLDELRQMDWVPRLVRSRSKALNRATQEVQARTGRKATPEAIAQYLEVTVEQLEKMRRKARTTGVLSLSHKRFEFDPHKDRSDKDVEEVDILADKSAENPQRVLDRKMVRELITSGLSRAERLIIVLYYFEELTMKEIAQVIGLTESRVSQMHSAILTRLEWSLANKRSEIAG